MIARTLLLAKEESWPAWNDELSASLSATNKLVAKDRGALGWLRARSAWLRVTAAAASLGAGLMLSYRGHSLVELVLHAVLFCTSVPILLWPLDRHAPVLGRTACTAGAVALPVGFELWVHANRPAAFLDRPVLPCLLYGAAFSASFLLLLIALDRRAGLGAARAWLSGSVAGVVGNAILHLHCADTGLSHRLFGHALLGVLFAASAWLLAHARVLRSA